MRSVSERRAGSVIPWHRRLEARVLFGVSLIAGLSLASIAFVTGRVVRSHTYDRARNDVKTARVAFRADNPGKWLLASTVLERFDTGLWTWFEVT